MYSLLQTNHKYLTLRTTAGKRDCVAAVECLPDITIMTTVFILFSSWIFIVVLWYCETTTSGTENIYTSRSLVHCSLLNDNIFEIFIRIMREYFAG